MTMLFLPSETKLIHMNLSTLTPKTYRIHMAMLSYLWQSMLTSLWQFMIFVPAETKLIHMNLSTLAPKTYGYV